MLTRARARNRQRRAGRARLDEISVSAPSCHGRRRSRRRCDRKLGRSFWPMASACSPALVDARAAAVKPSDPALLFFSSGSTGKPKGILNAHRGVNIQSWRWVRIYGFDHPSAHMVGERPVLVGQFQHRAGRHVRRGRHAGAAARSSFPRRRCGCCSDERVTFPYCWPHQWAQLEAEPGWEEADLSSFHYFDAELKSAASAEEHHHALDRAARQLRLDRDLHHFDRLSGQYAARDLGRQQWRGAAGQYGEDRRSGDRRDAAARRDRRDRRQRADADARLYRHPERRGAR